MASRRSELNSMKQARNTPEFSYELVAYDDDDEELYVTESFHVEEKAIKREEEANEADVEGVAYFEYREL